MLVNSIKRTAAAMCLAVLTAGFLTARADDTPSVGAIEAVRIASEAYIYGYPLVTFDMARKQQTNVARPDAEHAPMGQMIRMRSYPAVDNHCCAAPNADTLYTEAWLDVSKEPWIFSIPDMGHRYYMMPILDGWSEVIAVADSRTTGGKAQTIAITGPGWKGSKPKGINKVIRAETEIVIAAIRTQLFGPGDMENVKKVQAGYKIQPLSAYLKKKAPPAAPEVKWLKPVSAPEQRTSLEFFNELNFVLEFCPVHPSEKDLRDGFAKIGIVPGKPFDTASLAPEMKAALQAGMADGQKAIDERREAAHGKTADMFGTREFLKNDFLARAAGAQIGILANSREEAIYISYEKDSAGQGLSGKNNYRIRFAPGKLPPARAFWSLTLYDLPGQFLVANPLNRYLLNSPMLPNLKKDADGGFTFLIQRESPDKSKQSNWLPAPDGPFMMMLRIYWPKEQAINGGWVAPELERETNK